LIDSVGWRGGQGDDSRIFNIVRVMTLNLMPDLTMLFASDFYQRA